ncbi:MAG TPA: multiheme c-type cytochrome [Planctomycetota bacterium]|nr:multiheme c-type cytochrome [Planctomycetota bacterium]
MTRPLLAGLLLAGAVSPTTVSRACAFQEEEAQGKTLTEKVEYCGGCHREIHEEWKGSLHARAWTDPIFQAAYAAEKARNPEAASSCVPCHAPAPLLDSGLGKFPRAREADLDVGVDCFACHVGSRGMSGPHGTKYHRSKGDERFLEPIFCQACHGQTERDPVHDQKTGYETTSAASGNTCVTCHMEPVERILSQDEERTRRQVGRLKPRLSGRHDFPGVHAPKVLAKAADLSLSVEGSDLLVSIETRTGHFLPGGGDGRLVVLAVEVLDPSGKPAESKEERFDFEKRPLRPDRPEALRFPLPVPKGKARVRLLHHLLADPKYGAPKDGDRVEAIVEKTLDFGS